MPKRFKLFEVMKDTGARKRLSEGVAIFYGAVGPPFAHLDTDDQVAWLDLVDAAPPGRLERHHCFHLEITAGLLRVLRESLSRRHTGYVHARVHLSRGGRDVRGGKHR